MKNEISKRALQFRLVSYLCIMFKTVNRCCKSWFGVAVVIICILLLQEVIVGYDIFMGRKALVNFHSPGIINVSAAYGSSKDREATVRVDIPTRTNESSANSDKTLSRILNQKNRIEENKTGAVVINKILLFTQWRSGSSFVGEILKHNPKTFYMFEPMMFFHLQKPSAIGEIFLTKNASHFLSELFRCNLSYITEVSKQHWPNETKFRTFWFKRAFGIPKYIGLSEDHCKTKTNIVAKIIKVPQLKFVFPFVTDENVKTIYLVRDPRGVFMSRTPFLMEKYNVTNLDILYTVHYREEMRKHCRNIVQDYEFIKANTHFIPDILFLVRYEDVAYHPKEMTAQIYSFLGFNRTEALNKWLNRATSSNSEITNPYSTQRQSTEVAESWKKTISVNLLQMIQNDCREALHVYNYTLIFS